MKFFPTSTTFVQIGSLRIQWYAILILTGAFIVYYLLGRNLKKMGYESDMADDLFVGCLMFGIAGARIWYVLFSDLSYYLADPIRIIQVWNGGLAIQGGLFAGFAFAAIYAHKKKVNLWRLADNLLPYVFIAQAMGRWGNFINQEAFGQEVTEEYFAHWPSFLNFIKEGMYIGGTYHEPMFFYESVLCMVGFGLIMLYKYKSKPKRGDLGFCYLAWYGLIRFWIESRRSDSLMFLGLKMAQIISILFMVVGILGLLGVFRKIGLIKKDKPVLLFDLDGTLLNTEPLIHQCFVETFKEFKPDYQLSEAELLSFMGPTLVDSFGKYFDNPDDVQKCIAYYKEYNVTHHAEYVKPLPYVKECVEKWKAEGYRMAIVSSKTHDVCELGLKICEMDENFEFILGVGEYKAPKPDKAPIIEACKKMGVSHDNCIYVGDATSDVKAAQNAGVFAVAYVPNLKRKDEVLAANANATIFDFREMNEILKRDIFFTREER